MQTIEFFRTLYGDNFPGFLVFFDKEIKRSACIEAPQIEGLIDQGDASFSKNIYFGVCLQEKKVPSYMRGKSATTIAIPGVWLDVDFQKDNGKNYPPDMDTAFELLAEFPLEPTIIVHSGGGLHVYWLFNELWVFNGSEDRLRAQALLKSFNQHFKQIFSSKGFHLDSTSDLARVLRVPGTLNTRGNALVSIIHESGQRYTLEEIKNVLPDPQDTNHDTTYDYEWSGAPASAAAILEQCAFIRHCRDDARTLPEPEWYAMLSILGRCQGGEELCHILSQPYPKYKREETSQKLEHALTAAGPHTCKYIRDNITDEFCRSCKHGVKSPIILKSSTTPLKTIKMTKLKYVKRENPKFLIYPFLPRGEITLLDGDPGVGKSWVWMALAAGLTGSRVCKVPYDHTVTTDNTILILTTEDSIPKTVRGRLEDLGVDLDKIYLFIGPEGETATAEHLDAIREKIESLNPDLIVVDPITLYATTEKSFDNDKAVSVRKMLNKLLELTRQINCATIICRHMRKEGGKAIYRGLGSIDFIGTGRSGLIVTRDPKDNTRCLVAHAKSNLAPQLREALVYTLNEYDTPPFQWQGTCDADPDELTGGNQTSPGNDDKSKLDEAKEFLQAWLSEGPSPAGEVIEKAKESGISEVSLRRAKKDLGIIAKKSGKVWLWQLP